MCVRLFSDIVGAASPLIVYTCLFCETVAVPPPPKSKEKLRNEDYLKRCIPHSGQPELWFRRNHNFRTEDDDCAPPLPQLN